MMSSENTSNYAKALSASGAHKGGKARAARLAPDERSEIARLAAEARWGTSVPRAAYTGQLDIAGRIISCAVLENGTRLLTQGSFMTALGRAEKAKGGTGSARLTRSDPLIDGLPPFLAAENLRPFISEKLSETSLPIVFRNPKGGKAYGYDARLLPMVCEVYLKAKDADEILPSQERIVKACNILMRGLAQVGIIALVDEATGYQEQRAKDELSQILAAYISEELRPWIPMFPNEFFKQIYRLHGWAYKEGSVKRPQYIGKLINKWIYQPLPPGVLTALQARNPMTDKGYRKYKHHQFLTIDTGNVHLDKQITSVTVLMRISSDKSEFEEHFAKAFGQPYQLKMPLVVRLESEAELAGDEVSTKTWE
jgi:hypothetical protein